jgi:hypothetical protein
MNELLRKLKLKAADEILLSNLPATFLSFQELLISEGHKIKGNDSNQPLNCLLAFVQSKEEIKDLVEKQLPLMEGDAVCWLAYPKKSSKRYQSEIHRDQGWEPMGENGWEPVRQIALDEDWSALRFRKVMYIKTLRRRKSMALSPEGKKRTSGF